MKKFIQGFSNSFNAENVGEIVGHTLMASLCIAFASSVIFAIFCFVAWLYKKSKEVDK